MTNNPWIEFVKNYAVKNNTNYSCALADPNCLKEYKNRNNLAKSQITKKEIEKKLKTENAQRRREMRQMLNGNYTKNEMKQNKIYEEKLKKQENEKSTKSNEPNFTIKYKKKSGVLL